MSSPENMSKRERQKQRREVKLQRQRAAQARARRSRLLTFAVLGVILLALIGAFVWQKVEENRQEEARRLAALENLEAAGCTEVQNPPDAGTGHLDQATLVQRPPETLYTDRPATSGEHFGQWIKTGVYDVLIDERALVHNLEHGYVLAYYTEGAPAEDVTALKQYAQEQIDDGKYQKIIVSPWDGELADGANFAYVAWTHRQLCEEFDDNIFGVFVDDFHSASGDAPPAEKGISPHLEEGGGTIDPKGEPFLLPPLGTEEVPTEGMTEAATESTS